MATDLTTAQNANGGPLDLRLAQYRTTDAPPVKIAGRISDGEAASVFTEMTRVAERDLADRPAELAARLATIRAQAEAAGRPLPPPDGRTEAQRVYDGFWRGTDTTATGIGKDGYPDMVQVAQVELWKRAPDDNPPGYMPAAVDPGRTEALKLVNTWLGTAATPERAKELSALAERNSLVLRSLVTYANVAARYTAGRPR
jgi:hypothetical protein